MPKRRRWEAKAEKNSGADLGFEQKLRAAADKPRGHMAVAAHKHVVLDLIFLKCISDAFQERHEALQHEECADPEDRDEYASESTFRAPEEARRPRLQEQFGERRKLGATICAKLARLGYWG